MFCSKCGNEIDNDALICPKCGCATMNMAVQKNTVSADTSGETSTLATCAIVFAILLPIVGIILGIIGAVKYKTEAYKNKCITAIVLSVVVWVACIVFTAVISSML